MKIHYLALSFIGLLPACALAQTPTSRSTPQPPAPVVLDPEARSLLAQVIPTYKGINGISYDIENTISARNGKKTQSTSMVRYSLPAKLSISTKRATSESRMLSDGKTIYLVFDNEYSKYPTTAENVASTMSTQSGTGQLIGPMMKGHNPFTDLQNIYFQISPKQFKGGKVVAVEPRTVDGEYLQGLKYNFSTSFDIGENTPYAFTEEITAWFGGSPLMLRRVQTRTISNKGNSTRSEKIIDQQLSPTFDSDTFKFDSKGLKLASNKDNDTYWDPRLKVGTAPFAFSAKSLDGKTVSLSGYKGKVVLLDFWATWCGPCVAGLPELKEAYDKYHAKGLEVVGISLDEEKNDLTSFIKARKMPWPQLFDGKAWKSAIPTSYGVKAIPFLLLVGKDGKIAAVNPRGEIDKAVKAALAKK